MSPKGFHDPIAGQQSLIGVGQLKILLAIIFVLIMSLAPALAAPKGDNGNGGGNGGGKGGGNGGAAASVEAALGFIEAQMAPSGLVDSFVEDNADYSYTYDNALAAMAFISAGNLSAASTVLAGVAAIEAEADGGFLHRYSASDGGSAYGLPGVGHNAYLLQSFVLYRMASDDSRYDSLSMALADYLLAHQQNDGGLVGRAGVSWKSCENNLGAYSALHNLGTLLADPILLAKAELVRTFIVVECWDGDRFLTGENDPMIVTDVQALGALVLGAGYTAGAYWVEEHTQTTRRYKGRKTITGFDLNTDRDTVWVEGTLQQAMAFMTAGDQQRADNFKQEAEKLFQSSGALWQASNAGTSGFGDTFMPWQAIAPTAWYVFLSLQDNVLETLP